jgi:uncharacterized protein
MDKLSGRIEEKQLLQKALQSSEAEMIAIVGRRRVGKTFLINQTVSQFDFECTGITNATLIEQLTNFFQRIQEYYPNKKKLIAPTSWLQAFQLLRQLLQSKTTKRKKVIFIDELPWMDTNKSKFVDALAHFWNDYACKNKIVVILCGSAASWMIRNIVNNKGGLHNRITQLIHLQPFTLQETALYLRQRGIVLERFHLIQLYMIMGGVPYYLKQIEKNKSVAQNIDTICFSQNGFLRNEFKKLFSSLFDNPTNHLAIINALAQKWKGATRASLIRIAKLSDGGTISNVLEELENAAFISTTQPFGKKKKDMLYRICDPYTLFYLHFMKQQLKSSKGVFSRLVQSPQWNNWCGYAFENICLTHSHAIHKALGIQSIYTEQSGWLFSGNKTEKGAQIDMVIDRADNIVNLCELKFSDKPYTITKEYAAKLTSRKHIFKEITKTRKSIFITLVTTYTPVQNTYWLNTIQDTVTLDAFFQD